MNAALIDKYEIVARRTLRMWSPEADAAILIGFPFSPLPVAAEALTKHDIPYLVDVGDPWILTNPRPEGGRLRRWRAGRGEHRLWASARGAVVTTDGQAEALTRLFPHLTVLVRANGYNATTTHADLPVASEPADDDELRLVHYGSLHGPRVDYHAVFKQLASSGRWKKITLFQYGSDWDDALAPLSADIEVQHRPPVSWSEVLAESRSFDAAVVIGWRNPAQMPSKTVQYLTLPIPRIAITGTSENDALAGYVADKPGWVVLDGAAVDAADIVATHLSRNWQTRDLEPPESESWEAVEHRLADFARSLLGT